MELSDVQQSGDVHFKSDKELRDFISKEIGNVDDIENQFKTEISLANADNLPSKYRFDNNYIYRKSDGMQVGGITKPRSGWFTRLKSQIYMSPGIKGGYVNGVNIAKMTTAHEIIHAFHRFKDFANYDLYSERAASSYSLAYAKYHNMSGLFSAYRALVGPYPTYYSWKNIEKIISLW